MSQINADLDHRIKKLARLFLSGMYALTSPSKLRKQRDFYWSLGDSLDLIMRTIPRQRRTRPSGKDVEDFESHLKRFVGRDDEKLAAVERLFRELSARMRDFPPKDPLFVPRRTSIEKGESEPNEMRSMVKRLLRGLPGRHPKADLLTLYREALRLHEGGFSYAMVARKLLPELYREDPQKATSRVKAGVARLK